MSLAVVEEEVRRFLSDKTPEVLCIKGKWGVGKTFGWRAFLRKARDDKKLALDSYSYVSLFGLNSLDDLRFALFERTVTGKNIGEDPTPLTFKSVIKDRDIWRKLKPIAQGAAGVFNLGSVTDALAKGATLFVRDQLICFDDLERAGTGLGTREVLGLASLLKEERHCKVVLLLNDEEHREKDEFTLQLEKVADVTLNFVPTPAEAATIALTSDQLLLDLLKPRIEELGIINIRVIRKIERLAQRLVALLQGYDAVIVSEAVATLVLASWSVQQPSLAPTIEFLRGYNELMMSAHFGEKPADPDTERFQKMIADYPFKWANDLDHAVMDGAEAGYFVETNIKEAADRVSIELKRNNRNSDYSRTWQELYHGSLATDDDEFLDALHRNAIKDAGITNAVNINSAIYMLRDAGRPDQAAEVVDAFMLAHADERPEFFDLSDHFSRSDSIEDGLRDAFEAARAEYVDPRDPLDVLREIGARQGWDQRDVMLMSKQSTDDFERMFEALKGDEVRQSIEAIRLLARSERPESDTIERATTEALKRIAGKSRLRARKVARFGVKPGDDEAIDTP
ncbi:hypothetical protein [Erythrobacter sp. SG61-1L]|uniref:hypothetical protein n=1 Tax=Erythrobacter sp. SG61-1L TaxID=1603897 RepID=UPI000B103333|nr:hypothetical protein [Erythrobacter sp. SG61-1L]